MSLTLPIDGCPSFDELLYHAAGLGITLPWCDAGQA